MLTRRNTEDEICERVAAFREARLLRLQDTIKQYSCTRARTLTAPLGAAAPC